MRFLSSLIIFCSSCLLFGCQSDVSDSPIISINSLQDQEYKTTNYATDGHQYIKLDSGDIPNAKYLENYKNKNLILPLGGSGPKSFNYWASNDSTSNMASGLMYAGLTQTHPYTGEVIPHLAHDYIVSPNGQKITVHLRKGISWSDGKEITADDVLFTWNTIIKKGFEISGTKEALTINGQFPEITAPGRYTIVFRLKQPFAPLLRQLSYPIAPKHYFDKYLDYQKPLEEQRKVFMSLMGTQDNPEDFVVSGAYKLAKYEKRERIEYIKNPNYFVFDREGTRLPYIPKFTYVIMSSNDLQFFKFSAGKLPLLNLDAGQIPVLRRTASNINYQIYDLGAANTTIFVAFNMSQKGLPQEPQRSWFNNKNFRKALSYAIDRQKIIDTVYLGVASPLCLLMSENALFFHHDLHNSQCSATPNIGTAKQYLKKAGFYFKDKKLFDNKGNKVEFTLYTNPSSLGDSLSPRELMATILAETWKDLGIKVNLKVIEFNNLVGRVSKTRDWETIILGFSGSDLLEPHSGANIWKSNSRLHIFDLRDSGETFSPRSWEKQIDNSLNQGSKYNSFEQRKKYYYQLQQIIWDEAPLIYLASPKTFIAANNDLQNFKPTKLSGYFYNIDQWFYKN